MLDGKTSTYLGDGLYATFDGFHIMLEANGQGPSATDTVALEPSVVQALIAWMASDHTDYNTGRTFKETIDATP